MIKTVRDVKFLKKMLFNKWQRTLLKINQQNNLLMDSSSDSDDLRNIIRDMHDPINDDKRE